MDDVKYEWSHSNIHCSFTIPGKMQDGIIEDIDEIVTQNKYNNSKKFFLNNSA